MLTQAMDALLSPFYDGNRIRFTPLKSPPVIGQYRPPKGLFYPLEMKAIASAGGASYSPGDLAVGAAYVLCYQPMHSDTGIFRQITRAYVQTFAPDFPERLRAQAREAHAEGDWVGTIGRLWTILQIDPFSPEILVELAESALQVGFAASRWKDRQLASRLARVSGEALNMLHHYFPDYGPGHFCRAEFLMVSGDTEGAMVALQQALRLGLPPETAMDAKEMLVEIMG